MFTDKNQTLARAKKIALEIYHGYNWRNGFLRIWLIITIPPLLYGTYRAADKYFDTSPVSASDIVSGYYQCSYVTQKVKQSLQARQKTCLKNSKASKANKEFNKYSEVLGKMSCDYSNFLEPNFPIIYKKCVNEIDHIEHSSKRKRILYNYPIALGMYISSILLILYSSAIFHGIILVLKWIFKGFKK